MFRYGRTMALYVAFVLFMAVCLVAGGRHVNARELPDIDPIFTFQEEDGKVCGEFMQNRRFYFDDANFLWISKFHSKKEDRLGGVDAREGSFKATLFGLPSVATGISSLFGACDWWPDGLAVIFTMQNQVIMSQGDDPSDPWSVQMNLLGWNPAFEVRYCSEKQNRSFVCVGAKHTHWSGGSGPLVNTAALRLRRLIWTGEVSSNLAEVNVVTAQLLHSFALFDGAATLQYRLGRNLYNVPFTSFIEDIGGLTAPELQEPYPFPGVVEGKFALHWTHLFDTSLTAQSEFRHDKAIFMLEPAVEMYTSARRDAGMRFLYRHYGGMRRNFIEMSQWGAWFAEARASGFVLEAYLSF